MKWKYWYWKNILNMQQINAINKIKVCDCNDQPANSTKISKVRFIEYSKIKNYLNNSIEKAYESNLKNFKCNLFPFPQETKLVHNTYKKGGEYNWHIDSTSHDDYDIKFTVLINISNTSYTGGKFKLWVYEKPLTIKEFNNPGDMIMFRSFHLHKVTPILKGVRKTLTIFLSGPRLQ